MDDFNIELQNKKYGKDSETGKLRWGIINQNDDLLPDILFSKFPLEKKRQSFQRQKEKFDHAAVWRQVMCGYDAPACQAAGASSDHKQCFAKLKIKHRKILSD